MNDVALLAGLQWTELRNRVGQGLAKGRFKVAVIATFSVVFWWSLHHLFLWGMEFFRRAGSAQTYFDDMVVAVLHVFFFALTMMLVFSNAIIGYTSFYKAKETAFLMSAPLRPESIFLYKFAESVAFSSWAFLFLATPLMAAYGRLYHAEPVFYIWSTFFFAAYLFIPAATGSMIAMIVTSFLPRTRRGLILLAIAGALAALVLAGARLVTVPAGQNFDVRLASEVFDRISFSQHPLLPSSWMGKGLILLREGRIEPAAFFFALIAVNAAFFVLVAHAMASGLIRRGWFAAQGLRGAKRTGTAGLLDWAVGAALRPVRPQIRHMMVKDLKSFIRDPIQWSQFLIFFGLLAVYFLNLRTFGYEDRDTFWKNLIAQMNLLATALTLSTFSSRFIYPQLSLEGRRFWVMGMVPMPREHILLGKLALCFGSSLLISETLIIVSSLMLRTPGAILALHAATLFGVCLGISGLAVGFGAIYPNFAEDNPSKIVAGFGGTLNLVVSLCFVVAMLALQTVPCIYFFGESVGHTGLGPWAAASIAGMVLLSLLACLVPLRFGLRAIRTVEL